RGHHMQAAAIAHASNLCEDGARCFGIETLTADIAAAQEHCQRTRHACKTFPPASAFGRNPLGIYAEKRQADAADIRSLLGSVVERHHDQVELVCLALRRAYQSQSRRG